MSVRRRKRIGLCLSCCCCSFLNPFRLTIFIKQIYLHQHKLIHAHTQSMIFQEQKGLFCDHKVSLSPYLIVFKWSLTFTPFLSGYYDFASILLTRQWKIATLLMPLVDTESSRLTAKTNSRTALKRYGMVSKLELGSQLASVQSWAKALLRILLCIGPHLNWVGHHTFK